MGASCSVALLASICDTITDYWNSKSMSNFLTLNSNLMHCFREAS